MSAITSLLSTLGVGGSIVSVVSIVIAFVHFRSAIKTAGAIGGIVRAGVGGIVLLVVLSLLVPGISISLSPDQTIEWGRRLLDAIPIPEGLL